MLAEKPSSVLSIVCLLGNILVVNCQVRAAYYYMRILSADLINTSVESRAEKTSNPGEMGCVPMLCRGCAKATN